MPVERTVEVPVEEEADHDDHDDHMEEMRPEDLIGHVLGVHLEHMEIEEEWELSGAPANLTFVGVGVDDHHDDEHDHEDDH